MNLFEILLTILRHPRRFWETLESEGVHPLWKVIGYALFLTIGGGLIGTTALLIPQVHPSVTALAEKTYTSPTIVALVLSGFLYGLRLLGLLLQFGMTHIAVRILHGAGNWRHTLMVIVYGATPIMLFSTHELTSLIAFFWTGYLFWYGLQRFHHFSNARTAIVIGIETILSIIVITIATLGGTVAILMLHPKIPASPPALSADTQIHQSSSSTQSNTYRANHSSARSLSVLRGDDPRWQDPCALLTKDIANRYLLGNSPGESLGPSVGVLSGKGRVCIYTYDFSPLVGGGNSANTAEVMIGVLQLADAESPKLYMQQIWSSLVQNAPNDNFYWLRGLSAIGDEGITHSFIDRSTGHPQIALYMRKDVIDGVITISLRRPPFIDGEDVFTLANLISKRIDEISMGSNDPM